MPKKKTLKSVAKKLQAGDEPAENLRAFIAEADQVEQMTNSPGWGVVERDFLNYRKQKSEEIPYLAKSSKEFDDAILEFRAVDKLFKLIEDYKINRQRSVEALEVLDNPEKNIILDVDNK